MNQATTTVALPAFRIALDRACKAIGRHQDRPYLECLHVHLSPQGLTLRGATQEFQVGTRVPALNPHRPSGEGDARAAAVLAPPKRLVAWTKAVKGTQLIVRLGEGSMHLESDAGPSLRLECPLDPLAFPVGDVDWPVAPWITLEPGHFLQGLDSVLPAVAATPGRYAMHGMLVVPKDSNRAELVGTDGRRLHWAELPTRPSHGAALPRILTPLTPLKLVAQFVRALSKVKDPEEVRIHAGREWATYNLATDLWVSCQHLGGDFPRYTAVLPTEHQGAVSVEAQALLQALATVRAAEGDDSPTVRIWPEEGVGLRLSVQVDEALAVAGVVGPSCTSATVQAHEGFSVNPCYLADAVKATGAAQVQLRWTTPISPVEVRPVGSAGFRGVVMPITIKK